MTCTVEIEDRGLPRPITVAQPFDEVMSQLDGALALGATFIVLRSSNYIKMPDGKGDIHQIIKRAVRIADIVEVVDHYAEEE